MLKYTLLLYSSGFFLFFLFLGLSMVLLQLIFEVAALVYGARGFHDLVGAGRDVPQADVDRVGAADK